MGKKEKALLEEKARMQRLMQAELAGMGMSMTQTTTPRPVRVVPQR